MAGDPRLGTYRRKLITRDLVRQARAAARSGLPVLCPYCDRPILAGDEIDIDERMPRYLGGDPLTRANTRPAHRRCNRRAGALVVNARRSERLRAERARWDEKW